MQWNKKPMPFYFGLNLLTREILILEHTTLNILKIAIGISH